MDEVTRLRAEIRRLQQRIDALEKQLSESKPWYGTGHPVPWTPADGQW
jgi:BMFP domain-containing protein YqiC